MSPNEILPGWGVLDLVETTAGESQLKSGNRGIGQSYEGIFVRRLASVTYERDVEPRGQNILIDQNQVVMSMGESESPRVTVDFVLSLMLAPEQCSLSDFEKKDFVLRVQAITWHPLIASHH